MPVWRSSRRCRRSSWEKRNERVVTGREFTGANFTAVWGAATASPRKAASRERRPRKNVHLRRKFIIGEIKLEGVSNFRRVRGQLFDDRVSVPFGRTESDRLRQRAFDQPVVPGAATRCADIPPRCRLHRATGVRLHYRGCAWGTTMERKTRQTNDHQTQHCRRVFTDLLR